MNGKTPVLVEHGPYTYSKQDQNNVFFILNNKFHYSATHKQVFEPNLSFKNDTSHTFSLLNMPALAFVTEIISFTSINIQHVNILFSFSKINLFVQKSVNDLVLG